MNLAQLGSRLTTRLVEGSGNPIRGAWERLHRLPGGRRLFSRLLGRIAPYTGTIGAVVEGIEGGRVEVAMGDRRTVRNHLASVHAIALANLAELTGNLGLAYALPDDARFIVTRLEIDYLKKARGTIRGVSDLPAVASSARQELKVPVSLRNEAGEEVARAVLHSLVGPKRGA